MTRRRVSSPSARRRRSAASRSRATARCASCSRAGRRRVHERLDRRPAATTTAGSTRSSGSPPTRGVRVRHVDRADSRPRPAPTRRRAWSRAPSRSRRPTSTSCSPTRRVPRRARRRHRSAEPRRGHAHRRDRGRDRRGAPTPPRRRAHARGGEGRGRRGRVPAGRRRVGHPGRARARDAGRRVVRRPRRRGRPRRCSTSRSPTARSCSCSAPRVAGSSRLARERCDVVASIPMHGHIDVAQRERGRRGPAAVACIRSCAPAPEAAPTGRTLATLLAARQGAAMAGFDCRRLLGRIRPRWPAVVRPGRVRRGHLRRPRTGRRRDRGLHHGGLQLPNGPGGLRCGLAHPSISPRGVVTGIGSLHRRAARVRVRPGLLAGRNALRRVPGDRRGRGRCAVGRRRHGDPGGDHHVRAPRALRHRDRRVHRPWAPDRDPRKPSSTVPGRRDLPDAVAGICGVYMDRGQGRCPRDDDAYCLYKGRPGPTPGPTPTFHGLDPAETYLFGLTASCSLGMFHHGGEWRPTFPIDPGRRTSTWARAASQLDAVTVGPPSAAVAVGRGLVADRPARCSRSTSTAAAALHAIGTVTPKGMTSPPSASCPRSTPPTGAIPRRSRAADEQATTGRVVFGLAIAPLETCPQVVEDPSRTLTRLSGRTRPPAAAA